MGDLGGEIVRIYPDYLKEKEKCLTFLKNFEAWSTDTPRRRVKKYVKQLEQVVRRERKDVCIYIDDVYRYKSDTEFVRNVVKNSHRYVALFSEKIDELLKEVKQRLDLKPGKDYEEDALDFIEKTRLSAAADGGGGDGADGSGAMGGGAMGSSGGGGGSESASSAVEGTAAFPPQLLRRYQVLMTPPLDPTVVGLTAVGASSSSDVSGAQGPPVKKGAAAPTAAALSIRQVCATHIGSLVAVRGMVTRVSDVKPLVEVATYTCEQCGHEIYQVIGSRNYLPLEVCPTPECQQNQTRGKLFPKTRFCKFVRFQSIKIQELPDQVPVGHTPRSMTVNLRGELTRLLKPGDIASIGGVFLPTPYTGFRAIRAGLTADTYLESMSVTIAKPSYGDEEGQARMHAEMFGKVTAAKQDPMIYRKLAMSIAPEIFGHEDVKKALLLQLVTGVTRNTKDGLKIRGDINICLMGDPGVAKSQLLKYITKLAPRAVYTTGKGSSGVGLTAAVMKDELTGEVTLEGGALVLADMGICCIDEFDKMEESDRTAIHEVMEQQTVSIAKAGITTTLNARSAILAAANPLYGRYNTRKSMAQNINLPAALLSRFDLIFLLLDKADPQHDAQLADHITHVHRTSSHPPLGFEPLPQALIRAYIAEARSHEPCVPKELTSFIVEEYVAMRQQEKAEAAVANERAVMTARRLLSILRLSQGLARLRFHDSVEAEDVEEAIRLVHAASDIDEASGKNSDKGEKKQDVTSRIYQMICDFARKHNLQQVPVSRLEPQVLRKGFSAEQLDRTLSEYETLEIWTLNASRTRIDFV